MKKILSIVLCLFLAVSNLLPSVAFADGEDGITVYVSVCRYGELVTDKNGEYVAWSPIELEGSDTFTLDDALVEMHDSLYDGGSEAGYETAIGDFGLYVTKFWGDTSENFTYQVNFDMVYGPTHELSDGDYIEFSINKSTYPDTESYTKFDRPVADLYAGDSLPLTLSRGSFAAEGMEFSPCDGATITINGEVTDYVTGADGFAEIGFDETGRYVVSAFKSKYVEDEEVPDICAPVCIVNVEERPEVQLMHNIAEKYFTGDIADDGNMYWFIADYADYMKIYPESDIDFTKKETQKILDKIISLADSTESQGDLAKCIIALRALGYDAKDTYTKDGDALDIPAKLTSLITEESILEPYYEYTLPYVLIALEQGEEYADEQVINLLLDFAVENKDRWQDTTWGVDAAAPMLRALTPYYEDVAVQSVVDEAVDLIRAYQGEDGSMGNAASTGLAISGLASVGVDPETVINNEKTVIDGLMAEANDDCDGFLPSDNSFSTEQGMRGLNGLMLYKTGDVIYDFADNPLDTARATRPKKNSGGSGSVSAEDSTDDEENLETAEATETTEATETDKTQEPGLPDKNKDVVKLEVIYEGKTFEDITDHQNAEAIKALAARGVINGRDEKNFCPDDSITRAEFAAILIRTLGVPQKEENIFKDVAENDWFKNSVCTAYHYGIVNGVSDTEFNPNGKITREEAATMVSRAARLCGVDIKMSDDGVRNILAQFTDYTTISQWATESLALCYNEGILDTADLTVEPKDYTTRGQVIQMVYNLLKRSELI